MESLGGLRLAGLWWFVVAVHGCVGPARLRGRLLSPSSSMSRLYSSFVFAFVALVGGVAALCCRGRRLACLVAACVCWGYGSAFGGAVFVPSPPAPFAPVFLAVHSSTRLAPVLAL